MGGVSKTEKVWLYTLIQLGIIEYDQEVIYNYKGKQRKVMCSLKLNKGRVNNDNSNERVIRT